MTPIQYLGLRLALLLDRLPALPRRRKASRKPLMTGTIIVNVTAAAGEDPQATAQRIAETVSGYHPRAKR